MLLPLLSIMAMAAAAQPADTTAQPRDAYATCLRKFMTSQLDKKTKPDEFDKALQPACEQQETAFRNAILAADKAEGMSDTDAQEEAQFQVDDYLEKFQNNRSAEHTSELQSLMRRLYDVFCFKKQTNPTNSRTQKT